VRAASVTGMLQKLAGQRPPLVHYEKHRGVRLTATGKRRAWELVRHHRLLELWVTQISYSAERSLFRHERTRVRRPPGRAREPFLEDITPCDLDGPGLKGVRPASSIRALFDVSVVRGGRHGTGRQRHLQAAWRPRMRSYWIPQLRS
jgi:hypothetical protein